MISSDELDATVFHGNSSVSFLNLRGDQEPASFARKALRVLVYYARLMHYAATAKPKIFNILWNSKVEYFDRTFLMCFYKSWGRRSFSQRAQR
jgi:hypothetical protein